MTKLETIKKRYDVALERYKVMHPKLSEVQQTRQTILCGLCGASVNTLEINEHMFTHEVLPPANLAYQLTLPYRIVNGKIKRGAKFIKLLCLYTPNNSISVPYNALNLPDWYKLNDCNDVKIRYSKKSNKFIRTLWIAILLITSLIIK